MIHKVTIAGKPVEIAWTQDTAKVFRVRASKIGASASALWKDISSPRKAEYAVTALLWMLLPVEVYRLYPAPEDLAAAIDEKDATANLEALFGVVGDITPDLEKKNEFAEIAFARIELGLTESEWGGMHPDLAAAHVTVWENREKRIEHRNAAIQLTTAQFSGAKKKGGLAITLADFLPAWCIPKPSKKSMAEKEAGLKAWFMARSTKPKTGTNT